MSDDIEIEMISLADKGLEFMHMGEVRWCAYAFYKIEMDSMDKC